MPEDQEVQTLMDETAIRTVVAQYFAGLDRRDFDVVAACFAPDAEADFYGDVSVGKEAIIKTVRGVEGLIGTTHFMGNQLIDLRGDTASVETYGTAYYRAGTPEQQIDMIKGLRYLDEMVRRDGRWLIRRQRVVADWDRNDPVLPMPG